LWMPWSTMTGPQFRPQYLQQIDHQITKFFAVI